jgi:hypothetical protein
MLLHALCLVTFHDDGGHWYSHWAFFRHVNGGRNLYTRDSEAIFKAGLCRGQPSLTFRNE